MNKLVKAGKNSLVDDNFLRDGRAPIPTKAATSLVMRANRARDTKPEILLRRALWINGIRGYRLHLKKLPGSPDLIFSKKKLAIFVNGCYWHRCPYCKPHSPQTNALFWTKKFNANQERDKRKSMQLAEQGWMVITVWECKIKKELKQQVDTIIKIYNE